MALTKEFISAWYAWQQAGAPITNSRGRRSGKPSYEIEVALDHLTSHTYQLGLWAIEGKRLNYTKLASEEITELDRINTALKGCGINTETKEIFSEYISLTRSLLEEMKRLANNQDAV